MARLRYSKALDGRILKLTVDYYRDIGTTDPGDELYTEVHEFDMLMGFVDETYIRNFLAERLDDTDDALNRYTTLNGALNAGEGVVLTKAQIQP